MRFWKVSWRKIKTMRWHKITVKSGGLFHEQRDTVDFPTYTAEQKARMLYDDTDDQMVYGNDDIGDFVALFDGAHDLLPIAPSTYKLGDVGSEFLEVHADSIFGPVTGNVTGDMTGDIYNAGAEQILENGAVRSNNDGWLRGVKIQSTDGSACLDPSNTPSNANFLGTSQYAKYA
jgi:hypothetical protein